MWWNLGPASNYQRFWAPLTLAAVLLVAVVINQSGIKRIWLTRAAGLATLGLVAVILVASPVDAGKVLLKVARETTSGHVTERLSEDRYQGRRAPYAAAAARVSAGSKVLTAVDVPSLLLRRGFAVHTLDLVGSTSPAPHLPYFQGTRMKLSWLRGHGYDYIIAVRPQASACLYNRSLQKDNLLAGGVYGAWAPYYFDWFQFLDETSTDRRIFVAAEGPLVVLKVRPAGA